MMQCLWPLLLLSVVLCHCEAATLLFNGGKVPEQIHLSLGANPTEMVVSWSTQFAVQSPAVGLVPLTGAAPLSFPASTFRFVDGGGNKRSQFMHKAVLQGLRSGGRYKYQVGSLGEPWSKFFTFTALKDGQAWSPRLAVFGDLGLTNAQSVPRLRQDSVAGMYDAILHIGDFAYDMATNESRVGDAFMNMMQPVAASIPYMTCPGNHEHHYNFSNYKARFNMPGDTKGNMFYSFNMGPAHFISISTEYYYYVYYGVEQIKRQYDWLVEDLKEATLPENRAKRPWIILFGHRPMYCSNTNFDCELMTKLLRNGILNIDGIEPLLKEYGVDLSIWAHEHSYERLWPIYNGKVLNGSVPGKPYVNPRAPVHIVSGSAGCDELVDHFHDVQPFSAFRSSDYGYSRLHVINGTHLHWEQVSDDKNGKVIDEMVLVRTVHTRF